MKIIEQSAKILDWSGLDLYQRVEQAARVCRRSESKGDAEGFVRSLVRRKHFPPLEFARIKTGLDESENVRRIRERAADGETLAKVWLHRIKYHYPTLCDGCEDLKAEDAALIHDNTWIPVLITTSRTISHQLVRYRHDICFMQESQRHVRYDRDGIEVIMPPGLYDRAILCFEKACQESAGAYCALLHLGATAEQARSVLPGCVATRILAYASPQEWKHIFSQRCDSHADPQMSALMRPLEAEMKKRGLI